MIVLFRRVGRRATEPWIERQYLPNFNHAFAHFGICDLNIKEFVLQAVQFPEDDLD